VFEFIIYYDLSFYIIGDWN